MAEKGQQERQQNEEEAWDVQTQISSVAQHQGVSSREEKDSGNGEKSTSEISTLEDFFGALGDREPPKHHIPQSHNIAHISSSEGLSVANIGHCRLGDNASEKLNSF